MSGVKGINRNWNFIGEVIGAGNLYRTGEATWEIANVEYGRRIPGKFDGRVFSKSDIKAEFEFLGARNFGASGLVKQWKQRANVHEMNAVKALDAIAELQAIAQAQGEYA